MMGKETNEDIRKRLLANGIFKYVEKNYWEAAKLFIESYDHDSSIIPCPINAKAAYHLALCLFMFDEYSEAFEWLNYAIDNDSHEASYELGMLYELGITSLIEYEDSDTDLEPVYDLALEWYQISGEKGNHLSMYKCSEFYKKGLGTTRNYKKSFLWLLKVACWKEEYRVKMSEYFYRGIGTKKDFYEAYIWAIMAGQYCPFEKIKKLEDELIDEEIGQAQTEAEKRVEIAGRYNYKHQKLYEYMTQEVLSKKVQPKEKTEPEPPSTPAPATKAPIEEEEPEPSPDIEYKYVGVCRKRFNPEKVKIELVVNVKAKTTEDVHFHSIKITYNVKDTDKHLLDVLYNKGINYKQRRLLLALAAQFSEPDDEQRFLNIRKIVQAPDMKTCVSNLNAMFRAMFPGCEKNGSFSMIDRKNGRLFPQLKVDTTKIINARNYEYWRNK